MNDDDEIIIHFQTFYDYLIENDYMPKGFDISNEEHRKTYAVTVPLLWESYGGGYIRYCKKNSYEWENLNYLLEV